MRVIALILAMGMCSVAMAGLQNNEVIEIAEWIKKQVPVEMPSLENRAGEKGDPSNLFELMAHMALVKQKEVSTSDNANDEQFAQYLKQKYDHSSPSTLVNIVSIADTDSKRIPIAVGKE